MRLFPVSLLVAGCALLAAPVWSYPTCLNLVPTSQTLEPGKASVQIESDSSGLPADHAASQSIYLQVGLLKRLEVGADVYGVGESARVLANAKLTLIPEVRGVPGIAVGLWSLADKTRSEPYLVGSRTAGQFGLHLGTIRSAAKWQAMGGACWTLPKGWSAQSDFITGSAGYATLGATRVLNPAWSLTLYHTRTHERRPDGDWTGLNLAWQGSLL